MHHEALLAHEAKSKEDVSKLKNDISENSEKLFTVEQALTVTQDEMAENFSLQCNQMQLDYDSLNDKITKFRENDITPLNKEISELHSLINNGVLTWRISNVNSALDNTATTPRIGQTFYSNASGYALQPKIFFHGTRQNDHGHVSIFIQIRKGKFDPILKWPFAKRIRFTLIEQESAVFRRDVEKILMPPEGAREEIRRPSEETNNGFGIFKFVSHEVLQAGRYIVDDVMFVKIEVLDIRENEQSETL
ncbi:TNF receptor-associated factor 4-like [Dendronephthya gigantea]|uniref:TNF receptor-associated factor 4-like n=1 Tax=Dendronephthya gigantea TaxID=151771 RepID=UPI00106AD443|nr:TNF receptor-associated factor 4-like [Dendronephthya gigantea]